MAILILKSILKNPTNGVWGGGGAGGDRGRGRGVKEKWGGQKFTVQLRNLSLKYQFVA